MVEHKRPQQGLNRVQEGGHQMPGRGSKGDQAAGGKQREEDSGRQGRQWDEMGSVRRNLDYHRRDEEMRR